MNSDSQAGHKGAPASRSSKQSKAMCRDRVRTRAQPSPLGHEWLALCVDQGTDRQEQIDHRAVRAIGRNDRLSTALATRANLQVSDLPPRSGALHVWVGLVGASPPPVP